MLETGRREAKIVGFHHDIDDPVQAPSLTNVDAQLGMHQGRWLNCQQLPGINFLHEAAGCESCHYTVRRRPRKRFVVQCRANARHNKLGHHVGAAVLVGLPHCEITS